MSLPDTSTKTPYAHPDTQDFLPKRGRGRPRKNTQTEAISNGTLLSGNNSADKSLVPHAAAETTSTEPPCSASKCESCLTPSTQLHRMGALQVCKECHELMRAIAGSSRRQTMTGVLESKRQSRQQSRPAQNGMEQQITSESTGNRVVSPSSNGPTSQGSKKGPKPNQNKPLSVAPSDSPVYTPSKSPSSPLEHPASEPTLKAGQTISVEELAINGQDLTSIPDTLDSQTKTLNQTSKGVEGGRSKVIPAQFHSVFPSAISKKRGRKKDTLAPQPKKPNLEKHSGIPIPSGAPSSSDTKGIMGGNRTAKDAFSSLKDQPPGVLSKFQTTGAFLTRTASKLLGGQAVTGLDSNIHGYAYGIPVKVQNVDGTWYTGRMTGLESGKIRIRFDGWGPEWDEWLASDSRRLKVLTPDEVEERRILLAAENSLVDICTVTQPATIPSSTNPTQEPSHLALCPSGVSLTSKINAKNRTTTKRKISISAADNLVDSLAITAENGIPTTVSLIQKPKKPKKPSTAGHVEPALGKENPGSGPGDSPAPCEASERPVVLGVMKKPTKISTKPRKSQERVTLSPADLKALVAKVHVGVRVEAKDKKDNWSMSTVVQIKSRRVLVKFGGDSEAEKEWMDIGSERLKIVQLDSNAPPRREKVPDSSGNTSKKHLKDANDLNDHKPVRIDERSSSTDPDHLDVVGITTPPSSAVAVGSSSPRALGYTADKPSQDDTVSFGLISDTDPLSYQSLTSTPSLSEPENGQDVETSPAPSAVSSLGNPIELGLAQPEIVTFKYEDEEQEILRIIHRVLDTGLIQNRVVEYFPEEDILARSARKKKSVPGGIEGAEGAGDGEKEGEGGDPESLEPKRTNTKTKDRFVAILESRQERSILFAPLPPVVKKDTEELRQKREMAMRNMCSMPLIQFVRQIIYDNTDRNENLITTLDRKKRIAHALAGKELAKRYGQGTKKRAGSSFVSNMAGVTFNEAGYIESTTSLKIKTVLSNYHQAAKKRRERKLLKAMQDPNQSQDELPNTDNSAFQNLRSLTRSKKRKRVLVEDHITFLKRKYVPGTRIRARDRQMEWLLAVIRDVKNSRVLVHYEGFQEFHNEWIDINSERLRFDPSLEQNAPDPIPPTTVMDAVAELAVEKPVSTPPAFSTTLVEAEAVIPNGEVSLFTTDALEAEGEGAKEVHCIQCQVKISQFRIYCMYCEAESKAPTPGCESFNLCLWCFSNAFPEHHDHPRSSFATKVIVGPTGVRPVKGGIITRFEKDVFDLDYKEPEYPGNALLDKDQQLQALLSLESDQGYVYMENWRERKVCAFCNDEGTAKDEFIGPLPFLLATTNRYGDAKKKHFWAHDTCARHSPEVIQAKDGSWFNVSVSMKRGRTVKCTSCKEKGATIGCFDPKCYRSFHVVCTGKPKSHFEDGVIFWCPQHERALLQRDAYDESFSCDRCSKILGVNPWNTCVTCSEDYFHTFDLCRECFSKDDAEHEHPKEEFKVTSLELIRTQQLEKEAAEAVLLEESAPVKKKAVSYKPKMRGLSRMVCSYCWSTASTKWRKGYNGVLMCEDCFMAGPTNDTPMQPPMSIEDLSAVEALPLATTQTEDGSQGVGRYATSAEDYSHTPYLTRTSVSGVRFDHSSSQAVYLDSYGPAENQLYSLPIDTTYYDIPGRAPRWATHSGTDYHGTWLPQTVRRAVTKFTNPNDKILSNFLGRGTDAIECFLLGRSCTAVDINPAAITLSIRNCSFAIPLNGAVKAEHRPTIMQGDSRNLKGPAFENESFDHVLSHPPYKDCVAYSTHIDGDLSRFGNSLEFQREMRNVVRETYRLLKMGRRCTLGIGDNREHCFYIPVSFQLIRQYIDEGFELEELIVKRQRYCAMFGLGTYLCVQFDFLCFTHEFIATLRKVPKEDHDRMILEPDASLLESVRVSSTVRAIPSCPIERKSVVMGSVWTFKPTEEFDFPTLCASRMVERFGRNDENWEEFKLDFNLDSHQEVEESAWKAHAVDILPPEKDDLVTYERDRLQQIQENNRMLLALGLITDLSETSDDIGHQKKISQDTPRYPPPAQTFVRMISHIPCSALKSYQVPAYRTAIMHLAVQALEELPISGMFIVGAQDLRTEKGKLIPLEMLILEDIIRVVGDTCLRLKELIEAVPDGYQKDRRKITCWDEFQEEKCTPNDEVPDQHLPIVHACYLVFTKVKEMSPDFVSPFKAHSG